MDESSSILRFLEELRQTCPPLENFHLSHHTFSEVSPLLEAPSAHGVLASCLTVWQHLQTLQLGEIVKLTVGELRVIAQLPALYSLTLGFPLDGSVRAIASGFPLLQKLSVSAIECRPVQDLLELITSRRLSSIAIQLHHLAWRAEPALIELSGAIAKHTRLESINILEPRNPSSSWVPSMPSDCSLSKVLAPLLSLKNVYRILFMFPDNWHRAPEDQLVIRLAEAWPSLEQLLLDTGSRAIIVTLVTLTHVMHLCPYLFCFWPAVDISSGIMSAKAQGVRPRSLAQLSLVARGSVDTVQVTRLLQTLCPETRVHYKTPWQDENYPEQLSDLQQVIDAINRANQLHVPVT